MSKTQIIIVAIIVILLVVVGLYYYTRPRKNFVSVPVY